MRKRILVPALALVAALAVAVTAYAVPASQTTYDVKTSVKPGNAGTSTSPKPSSLSIKIRGGTITGEGSPQTSTKVTIELDRGVGWYGSKWPSGKRCSKSRANAAKSDNVCPRGSRIGKGNVTATAQPDTTKPKIVEPIALRAHVLTNGNLGLWLTATQPVPINLFLEGKIRGRKISVSIPKNVQEPVTGVGTGIEKLDFVLNGKVTTRGKTYGAVSSTACTGGTHRIKVTNTYKDGQKVDTGVSRCTR